MKKVLNHGKNIWIRCAVLSMLVLAVLVSCEPENYPLKTTDEVNMTGYFKQFPETYSKFLEILDRTETSAFLGAYGAYTIFAPTNEAVDAYLQKKGVSSVDELDVNELKNMYLETARNTRSYSPHRLFSEGNSPARRKQKQPGQACLLQHT